MGRSDYRTAAAHAARAAPARRTPAPRRRDRRRRARPASGGRRSPRRRRRLPERERLVPVEIADRAAGAPLVPSASSRQRVGKPGSGVTGRREQAVAPVRGRGSRRRRAGRRSQRAPVEHGGDLGCGTGRGPTFRAVVTVHDRHSRVRPVSIEPRGDLGNERQLTRLVHLPEPGEAPHLPLEVAGRLAEALETGGAPVGGVDLDERIDELLADPAAAVVRVECSRHRVGDDRPGHEGHDVEGHAEHALVLADGEDLRHRAPAAPSARCTNASRTMSCAEGGSGGRGGRRSTKRSLPSRSIRYVTFDWPSPIRSACSAPRPRRATRNGSTTSGGAVSDRPRPRAAGRSPPGDSDHLRSGGDVRVDRRARRRAPRGGLPAGPWLSTALFLAGALDKPLLLEERGRGREDGGRELLARARGRD